MALTHVDYDEVGRVANPLSKAKTDMDAQLRTLMTALNGLVESGFKTATASGKFRDSYQQWNTGATNMMEGLKGMETFLTQVVRQHGDLDTTLGSQLGS